MEFDVEKLGFKDCVPGEPRSEECRVRVAVLTGERIKLTFSAAAFAKLASPQALQVQAATDEVGANFLRLVSVEPGKGWVVSQRPSPKDGARAFSSCTIDSHPFKIGVIHRAATAIAEWSDSDVILRMPDWKQMLAGIQSDNEADGEE